VEKESRFDRDTAQWTIFQELLDRADQKGLADFSLAESETFFSLHRLITAQLVRSRTQGIDRARVRYLDALAKRGHHHLYPADYRVVPQIIELLKGGFAQAFRETLKLQSLAWFFILLGMWIGFRITLADSEYAYPLVGMMYPPEFIQNLIESPDARLSFLRTGRDTSAGTQTVFFTALFLNNVRAAFVAFTFGILAGVPTVFMLILNGALIGSVAALFHPSADHFNLEFWAWILPHAIPELLAVCIAAAGGLKLGLALIDSGDLDRRSAVAQAGRASAPLIGLSIFLLLYAAMIEAFVRQSGLSSSVRFLISGFNLTALLAYLSFAGRTSARRNFFI